MQRRDNITIVTGGKRTTKRTDLFNSVAAALYDYNQLETTIYPIELQTFNDVEDDPYRKGMVLLPLNARSCENASELARHVANLIGANCSIGWNTVVDGDESYTEFYVRVNAKQFYSPGLSGWAMRNWKNLCLALLALYLMYLKYYAEDV